ncbi:MAG TPA: cyanophycinase [Candidatus Angelobacter sp.]
MPGNHSLALKTACVQFAVLLLISPLVTATSDYDHSPTVGPAKGFLVIVGGGTVVPEIKNRFTELAGGPEANFVLIPTAMPDNAFNTEQAQKYFSSIFGTAHVTVLHTRDRKLADSPGFAEPLRHASGVWIEGGRQWRLADAYLGTAVEREIKALLARGGVVGGSSAGATIQGSYLVRGAPASPDNPDGDNTIMMVPGHERGFALLPDSAIDQHVIARHRESDLVPVIASHPGLLGIGIDQETAIVVHGDDFEVIGDSKVIIHDGKKPFYFLSHGQKFNLKTRLLE